MTKQQESLDGIRILDFTWSVSGSTTARILAALGAEVIKVEWPKNPDFMRFSMYAKGDEPGLDNGAFFNNLNAGKKSFTINVKSEKGMDTIHKLLKKSDVVLENFSAGIFKKWGFDEQTLREISPGIIYMSISGLGHTGRHKMYGTWGPSAAGLNGVTYISGLPETHPAGWGYSVMDIIAGYTGVFSVITALYHQRKTGGKGQHIDISQIETGLPLAGANLLDYSVNERSSRRPGFPPGNRSVTSKEHPENNYRGKVGVPHNSYRSKGGGYNDWCTIAIFSDGEWEAFKEAIGKPEWAMNSEYDTFEGRLIHQDRLDSEIETFTLTKDKYAIMEQLQKYGISCAAVQMNENLMEHDPQLEARGLFERLTHPLLGERNLIGVPIKMSETQPYLHNTAPLMGNDNNYVLKEVLEFSDEEIKELNEQSVLWPEDMREDEFEAVKPLW